ncbi:MAG: magnesium transporter [Alphaproteobacteria bacterium]|nr:magnesium transporter [Alphaproteobacteria bacterium]
MSAPSHDAATLLSRRFLLDYPLDAALKVEELSRQDAIEALSRQPAKALAPMWRRMLPQTAARLLRALPDPLADDLLAELPPPDAVRVLGHLNAKQREARLARLPGAVSRELERLLAYPEETAGRVMDPSVPAFRRDATVGETLTQLREEGMKTARSLFLVDAQQRLTGKAALADVALASPDSPLASIERPITASVRPIDPTEVVADASKAGGNLDLPVVDLDGVLLGVVTHDDLARTLEADSSLDIQTMVGASREERALSSPLFAVRKRMPWLQINLLTAFLAAAVVGLFENTIAQVTALAVLLPVVAGQSGNAGAQALAITMRGLALREVSLRQWGRVMRKEVLAGLLNGFAIAVTCGAGVYLWSQSLGLVAVIALSMVLAMVAAGFAGAVIPMLLTRFGQDPATSSSIILTTVTDVAGFFSFLGIATLLMQFL